MPKGWTVQPSNPYLLDALAKDFQKSNYSFKHLVRTIMKSCAYQLSSHYRWRVETRIHAVLRAQIRSDAESDPVAGCDLHGNRDVRATSAAGAQRSAMSMELIDPAHATREVAEMMRAFGQASRDEMPKRAHTSSLQAMLMMNSKVVLDRVKAEGDSHVDQLLKSSGRTTKVSSRNCISQP